MKKIAHNKTVRFLVAFICGVSIMVAAVSPAASQHDVGAIEPMSHPAVVVAKPAPERQLPEARPAVVKTLPKPAPTTVPKPVELVARRMTKKDSNQKLGEKALKILRSTLDKPFGSKILFEMDGKQYQAHIERHYHEPGGQARPWGWHRGISLFKMVPAS